VLKIDLGDQPFKLSNSETSEENSLTIYPQPASNALNLRNLPDQCEVILTDMSNRIVLRKTLNGVTETQLDVSNLPSGLFIMQVVSLNHTEIQKIIISN